MNIAELKFPCFSNERNKSQNLSNLYIYSTIEVDQWIWLYISMKCKLGKRSFG